MRRTANATLAMHRMVDVMGWDVASTGQAWTINDPATFDGLTYRSVSLLCLMVRVAMSTEAIGGLGLSAEQVQERIRFEPVLARFDGRVSCTDEITLHRAFS